MTNLRRRALGSTSADLVRRPGRLAGTGRSQLPPPPARTFFAPRWLGLHVFILVISVAMVLLGRWQLDVSNSKHFDLQNFGYAFQWWAFSLFALLLWVRIIRDARRPPNERITNRIVVRARGGSGSGGRMPDGQDPSTLRDRSDGQDLSDGAAYVGPADLLTWSGDPNQAPVAYRGYVMPQSETTLAPSDGDRYHASYNDYLWQLGLTDSAGGRERPPGPALPPSEDPPRPPRPMI